MSTVKIEFWNATFYRLELMPLKPEQVEEFRGYIKEEDWDGLSDAIWENELDLFEGYFWFDEPYNVGLTLSVDGKTIFSDKHAEAFFEKHDLLLPSEKWIDEDRLHEEKDGQYFIRKSYQDGEMDFKFDIDGEFDLSKLKFKYYKDGLREDEEPHISLNGIVYDGEEHSNVRWVGDPLTSELGIGTVDLDRDVYVDSEVLYNYR